MNGGRTILRCDDDKKAPAQMMPAPIWIN